MKKNILSLMNNNEVKDYNIILTFTLDDDKKEYIIYTDEEKDADGFIKTYAGIYNENNKDTLFPIKNDEEWSLIEEILEKIEV